MVDPDSASVRSTPVASSTVSSPAGAGTGAGGDSQEDTQRKRRNRSLLRNYYGLSSTEKQGDPLDIDSPASFNPEMYFQSLNSTLSVPQLLKRENDLLTEIRELDGERQSLVYNHHHELIDASDTIRKMRARALALDGSLESLRDSFQFISQLSASLSSPHQPLHPPSPSATPAASTPSSSTATATESEPGTPITQPPMKRTPSILPTLLEDDTATTSPPPTSSSSPSNPNSPFDPLIHLPALLALPLLLKNSDRREADALWGQWEPVLRSWEAGDLTPTHDQSYKNNNGIVTATAPILGVKQIAAECRQALKEVRARSASVSKAHATAS